MSMEGYRRRVGLSRLYHGSIMYLSRRRLWVSIMYLSGVVHTSVPVCSFASSAHVCADVSPEPVGTHRYLCIVGTCRHMSVTFCWDYIDTRRCLGTGRHRPVQSSARTNVIVGTCGVTLCHNVVFGLYIDFTTIKDTFKLVYM